MIIGITGKSGSGKTTVANLFSNTHEVIHVDEVTHLIIKDDLVKKHLVSIYGEIIIDEDNNIDRKKLGNILFNDSKKMEEYNKIIWVYIEKYIDNIILNANKDIVIDWLQLPLTKYFNLSEFNILVEAPFDIRVERVKERDNISEDYILSRERNTLTYNKEDFDYIIINNQDSIKKEKTKILKLLERS